MEWIRRNGVAAAAIAAGVGGLLLGVGLGAAGAGGGATDVGEVRTVTRTTTVDKLRTVTTRGKTRTFVITETRTVVAQATDIGGGEAGNCHPEYRGVCLPEDEGDVDCKDVDVDRFESIGSDPFYLDLDSDGIACEY